MAIDTGMYHPTQFKAAIKAETTLGTANTTAMQLLNIDSVIAPTRNPELFVGVRSGDGRTAKAADVYASQYGKEKTIGISGLYETTGIPILLENCTAVAVGTLPASYDVPCNFTGPECAHGDTDTDNTGALTFAYVIPEGDNSEIYPGCFVDELKLTADTANDGGRFHYTSNLKTRHNVSTAQAAPTGMSSYGTTYRTIYELAGASAVCQFGGVDVVLETVELTLKSNVQFYGFGANGIPQTIARGMPEFEVTGVFGMKFDANTVGNNVKFLAGTAVVVAMHNNVWASATFGWLGSYARITGDVNIEEVKNGAYVKIPVKFLASTSGDVIQIVP